MTTTTWSGVGMTWAPAVDGARANAAAASPARTVRIFMDCPPAQTGRAWDGTMLMLVRHERTSGKSLYYTQDVAGEPTDSFGLKCCGPGRGSSSARRRPA